MLEPCFELAGQRVPEVSEKQKSLLQIETERRWMTKLAKAQERNENIDANQALLDTINEIKIEMREELKAKEKRVISVEQATVRAMEEYRETGAVTILAGMNVAKNARSLSLMKEGFVRSLNDIFNPVYEYLGNPLYIPFVRSGHNPREATLIDAWIGRSEGLSTGNKSLDKMADGLIKYTERVEGVLKDFGLLKQGLKNYIVNPLWNADRLMMRFEGDRTKNRDFFIETMWRIRDRYHYAGWTKDEFAVGFGKAFDNIISDRIGNENNNFANRMSKDRYIFIGSGAGWAEANSLFGSTTLLNTLAHNVNGAGNYIATVKKFGADPAKTMQNIRKTINEELVGLEYKGSITEKQREKSSYELKVAEHELHYFAKLGDHINNKDMGRLFDEIAWMGRTKLGSTSVINVIGNASYVPQINAIWNNSGHSALLDILRSTWLNPNLKQRRRMLNDAKLLISVKVHSSFRDFADVQNNGYFKYLVQGMFNTIGAHRAEETFRQTSRHIIMNSIINSLKDGDLRANNRSSKLLRDWGFTEAHEELVKSLTYKEGEFTINDIVAPEAVKQEFEEKLLGVSYLESRMRTAVPTDKAQYKYHHLFDLDLNPKTQGGSIADTIFLLSKFNIANINNTTKTFKDIPTVGGKAQYASAVIVGGMMTGMLFTQVYNIITGKDPVDMTDWSEWQKAMFKGSLGNIAVTAFQNEDFGRGTGNLVMGGFNPLIDVADAGIGYINDKRSNSYTRKYNAEKNVGKKLFKAVYPNIPYSNYLYTRTAMDHTLKLYMQNLIDPMTTFRAKENARKRGDKYYFPIDNRNIRNPDFGRAVGNGK